MGGRDKQTGSGHLGPFSPDHRAPSNSGAGGKSSRTTRRYADASARSRQPDGGAMAEPGDVDLAALEAELAEQYP